MPKLRLCCAFSCLLAMLPAPALAQPIAGLTPWQRPAQAPVVGEFKRDDAWRARALTGVASPVPASLAFLDRQGAWYNPFLHPGMPRPYDLRGWHDHAPRKP